MRGESEGLSLKRRRLGEYEFADLFHSVPFFRLQLKAFSQLAINHLYCPSCQLLLALGRKRSGMSRKFSI